MEAFRQDLVAGTFTHRTTYLPDLLESWKRYGSGVPFCCQIQQQPILENFMQLRQHFRDSGKRFWLFLDDDVELLRDDTLDVALATLLQNGAGMVGAYSTFSRGYYPDDSEMPIQEVTWMPGYFQLVDSWKVGHVVPDLGLPDHNTSIDTTYSIRILQAGHKIMMAPTCLYHTYKVGSWIDRDAYEKTNAYLQQRYGRFYFDNVGGFHNIVGPRPQMEDAVTRRSMPWNELWRNRDRLIAWQTGIRERAKNEWAFRLHLGCGHEHYEGYVNIDFYETDAADVVQDIRQLDQYRGKVQEIVCQHVLEHISGKETAAVLQHWFDLLVPGGTLELGVPDLELCSIGLLCQPGNFQYWEDRIYGGRDTEGQFHRAGFTPESLAALLKAAGFETVEQYRYDANGAAPSIFTLARRPA